MKKSTKLYIIYITAVVIIGAVFMNISPDQQNNGVDKGTVRVNSEEESITSSVSSKSSTKKKKTAVRTTTTKAKKTTAPRTTSAPKTSKTEVITEPVELWFDLNSADAGQLAMLPNIGEKLADEIISYRNENGGFRNIEEIMNVSGIGEKTFDAIREYIYVIDPVYDEITDNNKEPVQEEQIQEETEPQLTIEDIAPLDLNEAVKDELMLLPHVDEEIANRIIAFRETNGNFSHPYELLYIEGLNRQEAAEIMKYIKVGDILGESA